MGGNSANDLNKQFSSFIFFSRLRPYLSKYTFDGSQEIDVKVEKPTKEIRLNCADITIKEAKFKGHSGQDERAKIGALLGSFAFYFTSYFVANHGSCVTCRGVLKKWG